MIIREAVNVLKKAKKISIVWNGSAVPFDKTDALMLDAYGRYIVDEIQAADEECYELIVAMRPIKEPDTQTA